MSGKAGGKAGAAKKKRPSASKKAQKGVKAGIAKRKR